MKLIIGGLALITIILSCNTNKQNDNTLINQQDTIKIVETIRDTVIIEKENAWMQEEFYIMERLPEWFRETDLIKNLEIKESYKFDNRLNPLYLENDFNGDNNIDIAIPVVNTENDKLGFLIVHGETNEIFVIGAGKNIPNGLSDDMFYIDIWSINRKKKNQGGIGEEKELILDLNSISIEKSEVGGGLIYWNGKKYAYFHQTC